MEPELFRGLDQVRFVHSSRRGYHEFSCCSSQITQEIEQELNQDFQANAEIKENETDKKMKQLPLSLAAIFTLPSLLLGNLNDELNNFYNSLGGYANVNPGDVYEGQRAGYMTGGGGSIRNRVTNTQIMNVTLPRFDAGCGGIDAHLGGFSFISSPQLVQALKDIGSNSAGFAFMLGLETASPQTANIMKQLQTWANHINALNINSCETSAQLVGSVWPRQTHASQKICQSLASGQGLFRDYAEARHKCSTSSDHRDVLERAKTKKEYENLLGTEFNIAWEALQKQSSLAKDEELTHLFMSLMGTLIVRQESNREGATEVEYHPSKIENGTFINALLNGGELNLYACNSKSKRCLILQEKKHTLLPEKSWLGRTSRHLLSIQEKILSDQELDDSERALLSKSRFPLYKVIAVLTAYKKGHCPVDLYHLSDMVAMDLLIQYLSEAVQLVREGAQQLKQGQYYSEYIDNYLVELARIERTVRRYETQSKETLDKEFQLMQKIHLLEEQIASEITL